MKSKSRVIIQSNIGRPHFYKNWNNDSLLQACKAVQDGTSPIIRAAEEYNIPRSTLHDYVSGKVLVGSRSGPRAYLSLQEEEELITFLTGINSIGYSCTIKEVISIVQAIVNEKGIDAAVTSSWYKSFMS
jgi:hypothetical protein